MFALAQAASPGVSGECDSSMAGVAGLFLFTQETLLSY